jgi:hypothetical protein
MPMPQGAQDSMSLQFEKKEKTRPAPVTKFALHQKQGSPPVSAPVYGTFPLCVFAVFGTQCKMNVKTYLKNKMNSYVSARNFSFSAPILSVSAPNMSFSAPLK